MRLVGILTVYMVIYGNYHCKDILHGTVPMIAVRNPEVAVGGYRKCAKQGVRRAGRESAR